MSALSQLATKSLFLLAPEKAHGFAFHLASLAVFARLSRLMGWNGIEETPPPTVLGLTFRSRLGLAAGFDKNANWLPLLPELGFGFAEIGTVTPEPQKGNELPRLWRDRGRVALFNRMGFNNDGANAIAKRVAQAKEVLPLLFRVGVNLGKGKDTPIENAAKDYAKAAKPFEGLADYLVINVSSPNTPGLRLLQTTSALTEIINAVQSVTSGWKVKPPILVKLAPELEGEELAQLSASLEKSAIAGWVLTNTLAGQHVGNGGGWSGGPLEELARVRLNTLKRVSRLPIISVGGILTPTEARRRIDRGAELIQIFTGWIYGGPKFPAEIMRALRK